MTSVFIVGAGGVGKTTMIDRYMEKTKSDAKLIKEIARTYMDRHGITQLDLEDDEIFWDLQVGIIKQQLEHECDLEGDHYISDRSVVDALAYAATKRPTSFPLLTDNGHSTKEPVDDILPHLFSPLVGTLGNFKDELWSMVQRYRKSLVVLVEPFGDVSDDGVRYMMSSAELDAFTNVCERILILLRIPFLKMRTTELETRVELLERAIRNSVLPSPLSSLEHYANITSKKVDRRAETSHYRDMNIPFYLVDTVDRKANEPSIPHISLSTSEVKQQFIRSERGKSRRFLQANDVGRLFRIEFKRDVSPKVVCQILDQGLRIQGDEYHFLGCSSGDLKKRACYLWRGTSLEAEVVREVNGEFKAIGSVAKEIARFGLLLTSVVPTSIEPEREIWEQDVKSPSGGNFTDGCGKISEDMAVALYRSSQGVLRWKSDKVKRLPSVFQIRFKGCKGILAVDSSLDAGTIVLRPSMKKFATTRFSKIAVCNHSRPLSYGTLNRQFILLLSGLGVDDKVFLRLQQEHYDRIRRLLSDRDAALMLLEWRGRGDEIVDSEDSRQFPTKSPPYHHLRSLQRQLIIEDSEKLRILIPKSRTLFGVAEPPAFSGKNDRMQGMLRPGECLVRLTLRGNKQMSMRGAVIVSKNPAYLLGDIRILQAVSSMDRPELKKLERDLVDCIVFPIEGRRPHSEEIAGSDLDGDQYFVCWDEQLKPPRSHEPYSYPAFNNKKAKPNKARSHEAQLIEYFSIQNKISSKTGMVDALFRAWANIKGVDSAQCQRLGQLFSRVVDSAKSGEPVEIPQSLVIPRDRRIKPTEKSQLVWQQMEHFAGVFLGEMEERMSREGRIIETCDNLAADVDAEFNFLFGFISRNDLAMSEFTKFRLIMLYFDGKIADFLESDFLQHVNFALFSSEERGFAIEGYGVNPLIVENSLLCHSRLVGSRRQFLSKYQFDMPVPWKFFWRDEINSPLTDFPRIVAHALRGNTDAMLLMQATGDVIVVLRFSRPVLPVEAKQSFLSSDAKNLDCNGLKVSKIFISVHAFLISGNFGIAEKYDLRDDSYCIDLSDCGMQVYRKEHRTTFIHLKVAEAPLGRLEQKKGAESGTETVLLSVDLGRFNRRIYTELSHPAVRKLPVSAMETFVFNRRSKFSDRASRGVSYLDVLFEDPGDTSIISEKEGDYLISDPAAIETLIPENDVTKDLLRLINAFAAEVGEATEGNLQVLQRFRALLQDFHHHYCMCPHIDKGLVEALKHSSEILFVEVLQSIQPSADLAIVLTDIFALLSDLGVDGAVLTSRGYSISNVQEALEVFIQCLRRWDVWAAVAAGPGSCDVLLHVLRSTVSTRELSPLEQFVFRNSCEQGDSLLSELDTLRPKPAASSSLVCNLRLDPAQPVWDAHEQTKSAGSPEEGASVDVDNLPTVTLFSSQSPPYRLAFVLGEILVLSLQALSGAESGSESMRSRPSDTYHCLDVAEYNSAFPPLQTQAGAKTPESCSSKVIAKRTAYCLGRVTNLCDAPFSISLKIIASSYGRNSAPSLILKALHSQPDVYWEIASIPANVITHSRNLDAAHAFFDDQSTGLSVTSGILPYLVDKAPSGPSSIFGTAELPKRRNKNILNARQVDALKCMETEPVSLVHGPGGTGKTTVATQMMLKILEHSRNRVLVCAETNLAVDNLATRFLQEGGSCYFPIRVGRSSEDTKNKATLHRPGNPCSRENQFKPQTKIRLWAPQESDRKPSGRISHCVCNVCRCWGPCLEQSDI